jgi:hypothetical protein
MGRRDDLIAKYAEDLKDKCGIKPDMDLLTKVTIGCGPSIYNADASTVSGSDPAELATVKKSFLIKKLGLSDSPALDEAIGPPSSVTAGPTGTNTARCSITCSLPTSSAKALTPDRLLPVTSNAAVPQKERRYGVSGCYRDFAQGAMARHWTR